MRWLDYISFSDDGGDLGVFQDDLETYSWTGCVVDTLVQGRGIRAWGANLQVDCVYGDSDTVFGVICACEI